MKKNPSFVILAFLLAALAAAAACTSSAPAATTPETAPVVVTAGSALLFGETYATTLDGVNEVLEYVASGDEAEKTEALENFVESGIVADRFWDTFASEQTLQKHRYEYGRLDDTRTAVTVSAIAIIREYDANKTVAAGNLQKFEDDFEAMRAAYEKYSDTYYASLPPGTIDPYTSTGAAISLRKMQADLLISVSESLEHVLIGEPEEMADFNAAMDRFETQAAAFNSTPFLHAKGNEAIAQQYAGMLDAEKEFRVAADLVFSDYEANRKISPQTFTAFEAATDRLRSSYDTLMASVLATV